MFSDSSSSSSEKKGFLRFGMFVTIIGAMEVVLLYYSTEDWGTVYRLRLVVVVDVVVAVLERSYLFLIPLIIL